MQRHICEGVDGMLDDVAGIARNNRLQIVSLRQISLLDVQHMIVL